MAVEVELCDRCSARAVHRYSSGSGLVLSFCGHHSKNFVDELRQQGFVDELATV